HKGFGDVTPAVHAKAAERCGGLLRQLERRRWISLPNLGLPFCRCHLYAIFSSFPTARKKRRTFSGSFFPGRPSPPEETSTPQGLRTSIASPTLPGFNPPATTNLRPPCRMPSAIGRAFRQSNGLPVPPGF